MRLYAINTGNVTWEVADGEAIVVHFESSAYYALNRAGTYVWTRIAQGAGDPGDLAARIAAATGRAPGEVAADLAVFLQSLGAEDLVTEEGLAPRAPSDPDEGPAAPGDYQPPQVTKFGELAKLILSGE